MMMSPGDWVRVRETGEVGVVVPAKALGLEMFLCSTFVRGGSNYADTGWQRWYEVMIKEERREYAENDLVEITPLEALAGA